MRGLEKNCMERGQTKRHTDIATTRKNQPKGRFFENVCLTLRLWGVLVVILGTFCVYYSLVPFFFSRPGFGNSQELQEVRKESHPKWKESKLSVWKSQKAANWGTRNSCGDRKNCHKSYLFWSWGSKIHCSDTSEGQPGLRSLISECLSAQKIIALCPPHWWRDEVSECLA